MGSPTAPCTLEDELALLLAGTAVRRREAGTRIAELSTRIDEERFVGAVIRQRVYLLAGVRLLGVAGAQVSPAFRARLNATHSVARVRAMAISTASAHLNGALEGAGIPAVGLKGGGLSAELYGDESLRGYEDIDVLVPVTELGPAVTVARSLGWEEADAASGRGALPWLHRALRHPAGAPKVELHWRIHWYETRLSEELIERSRMVGGLRRLDPFDELAALLLFYARDGFAGLRLATDIGAWWDRYGSPAAVDALQARLEEHRSLAEAWRAALSVSAEIVGLPVSVFRPLLPSRCRRAGIARRLANWDLRGDADQIMANITLADALLSPFPELPAFARRRIAASPSAAGVAKTLVRYAIALWRLRGGRRWSPLPW
jgi:Uncharacterised nucleotidyltransferase